MRLVDYKVFSIKAVHNLPFFIYYPPVLVLTKQTKIWENCGVHIDTKDENAFQAETEIDVTNSQTYLTPDLHLFGLNKRSKISLLFLTILHPVFTKLLLNYFHFCSVFSTFQQT